MVYILIYNREQVTSYSTYKRHALKFGTFVPVTLKLYNILQKFCIVEKLLNILRNTFKIQFLKSKLQIN